jgi:hypothetical protein
VSLDGNGAAVDAWSMTLHAIPAWTALAGGVLLAIASVVKLPAFAAVGALLFVLGIALFLVVVLRRARAEGIGKRVALGRGVKESLRVAWHLLP